MFARQMTIAVTVVLASTGLALGGCSADSAAPSVTSGTAATQAPAQGSHLDTAAFAASSQRAGTVLLDVRTPEEFASGHLAGSVNLDYEGDFVAGLADLDPNVEYAVYCRSGNRSAGAVSAMVDAGFTRVYDLSGGILAWQADGGEVVTGD